LQNPQTGVLPGFVVDDVEDEEDALAEVEFDEDNGDGLALTARGATAFVAKEDAFEFEFELDVPFPSRPAEVFELEPLPITFWRSGSSDSSRRVLQN